jgi:beta-lactamase regulating signal transducer with metallopeptidase domain
MNWASLAADLLWRNAWAVIPLAVLVAIVCRCLPHRPATRHMLWLVVLLAFVVPLALPEFPRLPLPDPGASATDTDAGSSVATPAEGGGDDGAGNRPARAVRGAPVDSARTWTDGELAWRPSLLDINDSLGLEAHRVRPEYRSHSLASGESATPPGAVALTEPCVLERLPAAPGSVERLPEPSPAGSSVPMGAIAQDNQRQDAVPAIAGAPREAQPESRWWHAWVVGMRAVRDAVGQLPAMPVHIWVAGLALLGLSQSARVLRFRRRLHRSLPAPPSVARSVKRMSYAFGLKRTPETLMVDGCVSPMICCGRKTRLILPARLWTQLDRVGRTAVLCHELAHLRRRDHWVRWIEMVVSALYWWHPVVWWARRRLHEESELCCDAWVTWLMPERRRAYAETLLRTKQFVASGDHSAPAAGISVTSVGARRFARRLTMVMTQSARPKPSASGILLAAFMALVGWVTMPAWAYPEDPDKSQSRQEKDVKVVKMPTPTVTILGGEETMVVGPELQVGPAAVPMVTAVGGPRPVGVVAIGSTDDELEERLEQLERELEALAEQLAELHVLARGKSRVMVLPEPPTPPTAPRAPVPPTGIAFGGGGTGGLAFGRTETRGDETIMRSYRLPKGKLEALTELMVRQDVPVLVSPQEDRLDVHATASQHEVFAAFVELIHPSAKRGIGARSTPRPRRATASAGTTRAYSAAMKQQNEAHRRLSDVLKQFQQSKLDAAVRKQATHALQAALQTQRGESAHAAQAQLEALLQRVRGEAEGRGHQATAMEAEAEELLQQAEELEIQAEALIEHAAEVARSAKETGEVVEAKSLREEARALERQARELECKARELERRARDMERKAQRVERDADELDDSADELESALDVLGSVVDDATAAVEASGRAGETR